MKKKRNLVLLAALFAAGVLSMNRLPAKAAGEQAGQEQNAEVQDEGTTVREETAQPMAVQSGICGENVTWTFDEESGTLTISGSGPMEDWGGSYDNIIYAPWNNIKDEIKSVVIQEGVTSIGAYAFKECGGLKEIILPQSISKIGEHAFETCKSLKEATVPNGITVIEEGTFMGCGMLEKIILPESVTCIGDAVFRGCESLRNLTLPNSITDIGDEVFCYCDSLEEITFSSGMSRIGDWAFYGCSSLTRAVLPAGVTSIGTGTFYGCNSLISVALPAGMANIGDWAFYGCSSLKDIVFPEKLEYIGQEAFYMCSSLTEVTIPASVSKTGDRVFGRCYSLKAVYFMGGLPEFADMWYGEKGMATSAFGVFEGVTADVYYSDDPSWNADIMQNYGGDLTWLRRLYIISEEAGEGVTDKIYAIGSGTDATIKCSGAAEDFVSLAIDGEIVDPSYYKVESGSTVLTVLSAFLDKLSVGDHKVTLNYTYGSVDTVLTVIDKQENTEKPGNTTKPENPTKPAGDSGQTGAVNQQTEVRKSPQTGEPQTEESWSVFATVAVMACIGGAGVLVWKRRKSSS